MLPHSLGKLELPMNFNAVIKCEVMKKKFKKKIQKKILKIPKILKIQKTTEKNFP